MQRRDFITLLAGAAAAWPLAAYAQQAVKLYRIGILSPELPPPGFLDAFRQGLHELGYIEGHDIAFEIRSAEGYGQRLAALANLLVGLKVDVILLMTLTRGCSSCRAATAAETCVAMAPAGVSATVVYRQRSHIAQRHGHSRPVRSTVAVRARTPSPVRSSSTISP